MKPASPYRPKQAIRKVSIKKVTTTNLTSTSDKLTVEEPLEIKVAHGPSENRIRTSLAVTMRTPGQDLELAIGFLFTEAIIGRPEEVITVKYDASEAAEVSRENSLVVELTANTKFDPKQLSRNFYTTSSCGVCGKSSIDMVFQHSCYSIIPNKPLVSKDVIYNLTRALSGQQSVFHQTGGIHAAALFSADGSILYVCEDVGRHNAMDKLIGKAILDNLLPLKDTIVLVSGRASFELVQKALMAGIPMMAAVGAPSSLAVQFAEESGMTLIGFLKDQSFNIYSQPERIS